MTEVLSYGRKISKRALTVCRRGALAEGSPPGGRLNPAFLSDLRKRDAALDLYWHPVRKRWILYRIKHRGACPSDDYLIKELEITGPNGEYRAVGPWLIEWLQKNDKTRGGSLDVNQANRAWVKKIYDDDRAVEDAYELRKRRLGQEYSRDVVKFAVTGRKSEDFKNAVFKKRKGKR